MNSSGDTKTILTPHEMAILFGFPSDLQQRLLKERDYNSPSKNLDDHDNIISKDINLMDLERVRTSILESINFVERRIERMEDEKQEHMKELEKLSNLAPSLQSLKEKHVRMLIKTDKVVYDSLGIELRKPERGEVEIDRPYPTRGVATIGVLMFLVGSLILLPFEIPITLKFVFGAGFLMIGFAVLISGLLHAGNKSAQIPQQNVNSS